jgi:hypothetical protein
VTVLKCALGVIQDRGKRVVEPSLVTLGPSEADYVRRHVDKVRSLEQTESRSLFNTSSSTPKLLRTLQGTADDAQFEKAARELQDALASAMKVSTNALDCVFAIVRANDQATGEAHVTLLKLDAIIEAAKMELLNGRISLQVLEELLPEPGKLQKALSWPDARRESDVIMLDRNVATAKYFENAFQVKVSPKSVEAEAELHSIITDSVAIGKLPEVFEAAARMSGPMDDVLADLASTYPELTDDWVKVSEDPRPSGMIRENKLAARMVIWRADGIEIRVPPNLSSRVNVERLSDGWRLSVETVTQPRISG